MSEGLPPASVSWRTVPLVQLGGGAYRPRPLGFDREAASAARQGRVFRELRMELALGLRETAAGFGVSATEVSALERGERLFASHANFRAALDQLWAWADAAR